MVKQYPHTLVFTTPGTDSTYDENGWPTGGEPGVEVTQPCRYEDSRMPKMLMGTDNETHQQAGTIYLPKSAPFLPSAGTGVEVPGMFKGRVAAPYRGQLNISIKTY